MPTYDTPPSIDPITGRIPPYKQVLKQDATTGVWSTKYEYSVTPTTPTVNTETMGTGTYGGTTTTTGAGAATGTDTNNTPFEENPLNTAFTQQGGEARQNERDRQEREANKFDPSTMSISQLQAVVNPSFGDRAVQTGASFLFPGIGLLTEVNKFRAQKELDKRMEEVQETYQSPEYRAQSLAQERGGFIQSPQQKAMADRIIQDPMTGDASIAEEIAAQNRYQRSLERRLQNIEQERGGAIRSKNALIPGSVQRQMETAKLNVARGGGSRDKGEEASTQAFNDATSGFKYDGESRTSFEGTPQETTLVGTFSERRAKEEEGRNEDGTTQPGSIAELRDIAATQTQPKAREVDRSNPVSNKAGRNEVGDRNGNAVTNNGKAVNFGPGTKAYDRMQEKRGGNKGGDKKGRIICSELYKQNLISKEDYMLDLYYTSKHLTEQHTAGYWYFAVPAVKAMRRSKFWTAFWKEIAYNRLQDIKWRLGKGKFNLRGRIYSLIFEPFCYISGYFTPNSNYTKLYEGENQW